MASCGLIGLRPHRSAAGVAPLQSELGREHLAVYQSRRAHIRAASGGHCDFSSLLNVPIVKRDTQADAVWKSPYREPTATKEKGLMKFWLMLLALAAFSVVPSFAQEINTVESCRADRQAWITTAEQDFKKLLVAELIQRGDQMIKCAREIDNEPLTAGITYKDALKVMTEHQSYAILTAGYRQEVMMRALWFIDNKRLSSEFTAADKNGTIVIPQK